MKIKVLRVTHRKIINANNSETVLTPYFEPLDVLIHAGQIFSDPIDALSTFTQVLEDGKKEHVVTTLLPVELISDMNNDGKIDLADNPLRDAALASGASEDVKDLGTEFILHNDQLSNGLWDREDSDSDKPATAMDDDDAEGIVIKPGITEGEVWLDHPAIAGLSFYKTRECNAADRVNLAPNSKFSVSSSNPFPAMLFVRADGTITYPDDDPQVGGDLVLKVKVGTNGVEIDAAKMKFMVVKGLGAKKYFHAVRDYILENNTKTFTQDKDYGMSSRYRIVAMREESTIMYELDTYDHAADAPRLKGIDEVKANYGSDVIINGNQCFHTNIGGYPLPGGMTNRCDGRLCIGRNILRPPSDDTHNPFLGGTGARYVGYTCGEIEIINGQIIVPSLFTFATGRIPELDPATPDQGIGGLAAKYSRAQLQQSENQAIGRGKVIETGKGIVFTVTSYVGNVGSAVALAADAHTSGVQPLAGGDGTQWELLFLDGSSSVGLVLSNPNGNQKTLIKGSKHNGGITSYYINTYLLFECTKPRNP